MGNNAENLSRNNSADALHIDPILLNAIIDGTMDGVAMAGIKPNPVGASRFSVARHNLAVIVGLVGVSSGSVAVNMSESSMLFLAGQLIGETVTAIDEETIDAAMEIGNITAGCIKDSLVGSGYGVSAISLPSLIIGSQYSVMYARGITSVSVEFEIPDLPVAKTNERLFSTTVSLLRSSGG